MKRKSSIELLRILAMLGIVAHHFVYYGLNIDITDFSFNSWVIHLLYMGGKLGVDILMLISGYFYENTEKIKPLKIIKTFCHITFYSVLFYLIFGFINGFTLSGFVESILAVPYNKYWFGTAFFILLLLQPYISKMINNITVKEHRNLCFIMCVVWVIIPLIGDKIYYNDLIYVIGFFIFGAYLKRKGVIENISWMVSGLLSLILPILIVGLAFIMKDETYFFGYRPLIILLAVLLFATFKNIPLKDNKFINNVSKTNLGVYLIHDNWLIRNPIWLGLLKVTEYQNSPYLLLYAVFSIIIVYIICSCLEFLRLGVMDKIIDNCYTKYLQNKKTI